MEGKILAFELRVLGFEFGILDTGFRVWGQELMT